MLSERTIGREQAVLPQLAGPWSSGDAAHDLEVLDPATGERIAVVAGSGASEVAAAAVRGREASASWRWEHPRLRGRALLAASRLIREHADELAALETWEMGKPFEQARLFDVEFCADSFEFYGGLADKIPGETFDLGSIVAHTFHEPFGVVAGVIPFNWPPIHFAAKTAPALATGNAVVLKPPEQGPLTIMRLVELLAEVLPEDLLQVVPGTGPETGQALVGDENIGKVFFTGSTTTARAVMAAAAQHLTPTSTELGGKNALVVFADADLDLAVRAALEGSFFNQGEACTASSRLLVERSIEDAFVARLADAVPRLCVGDGFESGTHVGPMVTDAHRDRVQGYLDLAASEGATVRASAPLPTEKRLAGGSWVAPTLLGDVTPDMTVAREEIFGPVTFVLGFEDEDEAVRLANDSEYGLVAGVFSGDAVRLNRVARRLEVGMVMVNNYNRAFLGSPFGGVKASGSGREHALESVREFVQTKNVRHASGLGPVPRWRGIDGVLGDD